MEERYELARERIRDIAENEKGSKYCQKIARFFMLVFAVYERRKKGITISCYPQWADVRYLQTVFLVQTILTQIVLLIWIKTVLSGRNLEHL